MLDNDTKAKLVKKFQIAYMIAKENMAFKKMEPLCVSLKSFMEWNWAINIWLVLTLSGIGPTPDPSSHIVKYEFL